ncbi:YlaN family protein [Psychrobacillus sp.]|uniref:YlaN family protein n=1 Tax=Psychrobacillus sp. TaxID=1871623 RepID=UPI0028BF1F7C|nr:YlaN family protein [Psychrobacillus sp.]
MDTNIKPSYQEKALELLKKDAEKIAQLIKVQMDNLMMPQCPLYEEVLDTQMFGLSREIDFAVKLGLLERSEGKEILASLENELSALHDVHTEK